METAITVFAYELLDTFISDLIKYGKLDKNILNYTHINRSNDLLKNRYNIAIRELCNLFSYIIIDSKFTWIIYLP